MPDIWYDVDAALAEVPVNIMPLIDDTDFKSIEGAVAYNAAGMALRWHFVTCAGAYTVTSVTPTTGGNYDWTDQGDAGIYTIEIPASGGASINNDTEGFGWFTGVCTGVLPWRGPVIGFRASGLNDKIIESAYDTTRGLAGTALPAAAAEAAGGLYTRGTGAGQINQDGNGRIDTNVAAISADTTAADNCESMFDGTGYAGGTARLKVDVDTMKTQSITCGAGVTVGAYVGQGTAALAVDAGGRASADVKYIDGAAISTHASGMVPADVRDIAGSAVSTTTAQLGVNVVQVSGDATAADNLEAACDGNTYNIGGGAMVAASVTGAVGSVTGNVGGNVTGSVGSVASGGITAASIATGAIDADALASDAVDEILDEVVEGSVTLRQAIRLFLSALTGKASGGGTTTITFRDIGDTKDRIIMTVDSSGNRSAVGTRDGS